MAAPIAFEPPSVQKAWQAFLQHIPVVLVSWVGSIVLSLLAVLVYGLIIVVVSAIIGSSDAALGLGAVLAQLVQLPFSILASLLSVLLVAVPALYYERGEVVTISAAAQLLIGVGGVTSWRGCSSRWSPPLAFCSASFPALPWRW